MSAALSARAKTAGLTVRAQGKGRTQDTITLEGPTVPDLTDQELLVIAGLTEARHFGGTVRRWDAEPTIATITLHTD